jgi:hypothetical protein
MSDNRGKILASAARLKPTLGSDEWLNANKAKLSLALPLQWKRPTEALLSFGFAIKLAGVEWEQEHDLLIAMQWLAKIGIAESIESGGGSVLMIRRATANTTH